MQIVFGLALLLTIVATSCRNEREGFPSQEKNTRHLTLTASMPSDGDGLRVGVEKNPEGNTLITNWKSGDKITFIFKQGTQLTPPIEVLVTGMEGDGKFAKLNVEVPESIDVDKSYTVHAFCGIPDTGVRILNKEIVVDVLPLRENRLEGISVPVISKMEITPESEPSLWLTFDHLGSIEYIDLKNASDRKLRVSNCHLYPTKEDAEEWRYLPKSGKHYLYKPMSDEVVESDGDKSNPIDEEGPAVTIAPGATHTFAVWHRPTGKSIPEFGISMKTDGGVILSDNRKVAKAFSMTPGKAYRVQAEWKRGVIKILGEGVEEDLPFMTLTTAKAIGNKIWMNIDADEEDRPDVWIDLNNNKVRDPKEDVTSFDTFSPYTLGSQTITVYGRVTVFICGGEDLTSLDLSQNGSLIKLLCSNNRLTSLDISHNRALKWLHCDRNQLTSLDISRNRALERLDCEENLLASLDVSKNTALLRLFCRKNQFTSLDVSKNVVLKRMWCQENQLTSLDVSKNTALEELWCQENQLTSLDVSKNIALKELRCTGNQLTSLDVSKNIALTVLECQNNENLSSLKISSSINNYLYCHNCNLGVETLNTIFTTLPDVKELADKRKEIDIQNNPGSEACSPQIADIKGWTVKGVEYVTEYRMTLTTEKAVNESVELYISANPKDQSDIWIDLNNNSVRDDGEGVTSFDTYSHYPLGSQNITVHGRVTKFYCRGIGITALDVRKNAFLTKLNCSENQLASLDVSQNTALKELNCSENQLASLDVSQNTALTELNCKKNKLTSLNVSKSPALKELNCSENQLASLDIGQNKALWWLECENNKLTSLDVSKCPALTSLRCWENQLTSLDVSQNKALTSLLCSENLLTSLDLSQNTGLNYLICSKNQLASLDVRQNTALTVLYCEENHLKSLDLSQNTGLDYLICSKNQLASLDVRQNTALTVLFCAKNELTALDISKNTALTQLYCSDNQLSTLDVSKNTTLRELYSSNNQLTLLDVSKNIALTKLICYSNLLSSLDVSQNTHLTYLDCEENKELSSLKISGSINDRLYCRSCKLNTETLNTVFTTLPDVKNLTDKRKEIYIHDNPGTGTCNRKIAVDKGWTVSLKSIEEE
ncbi:leucine-rich repeat domain-containing protein [Porphyromonas cangingivalis]|uniref:leucine-rich repeat domain-containing protein n=1 Tax=Porphyromonas cangingivalis TaxID=36874 RepID=UPI00126A7236|nr:hypothetical protein [Porphyromonas cangingivalis]